METNIEGYPDLPYIVSPVQVVAGSDNGKSGSIVFLRTDTAEIVHIESYSNDAKRLYRLFEHFKPVYACSEEVFMSPGFRGVASTDYQIMGRYSQVFEMLDIPYHFVRAKSWRPKLGIKGKGRDFLKQAALDKAKELFSEEDYKKLHWTHRVRKDGKLVWISEPDNNMCESALIAYYALQHWRETNV